MSLRDASPDAIAEGARILRAGGLVAFPTETVYGLGADATQPGAIEKIYKAKERPSFNPLIVHIQSSDAINEYADADARAASLTQAFWPGPLTLVMKRLEPSPVASIAAANLPSIALRCPAGKHAQDLLKAANLPLAAPSANKSGTVSPTRAEHVKESLGDSIDLILDGGPCEVGVESTVLDLTTDTAAILRPGAITQEQIETVIGAISSSSAVTLAPKSPGQMQSHYAPTLPVRLNALTAEVGEAFLGYGQTEDVTLNLSSRGDINEAAANLFAMLRSLDEPKQFKAIAVAPIPETGMGIAINDRLRRAATK